MADLVLKSFYSGARPNSNGNYIEVVGRQQGLIAFLLGLVNVDPTVSLTVTSLTVTYKEGSFFGNKELSVPRNKITGIQGGWRKPKAAFFLMLGFGFASLSTLFQGSTPGFIVFLLLALICGVVYFLSKALALRVSNGGDLFYGLSFKRSVIEGIAVDEKKVEEARQVLTAIVLLDHELPDEGEIPESFLKDSKTSDSGQAQERV